MEEKNITNTMKEEARSIVPLSTHPITFQSISEIMQFASFVSNSELVPKQLRGRPESVALVMLQALELQIPPITALHEIYVTNGVPTVKPKIYQALILRSGVLKDFEIDETDTYCEIYASRNDSSLSFRTRYTLEDAKQAGLLDKQNWRQMPKIMLYWRCLAKIARVVFPDVIGGLYTIEEINPQVILSEDGEIVGNVSYGQEAAPVMAEDLEEVIAKAMKSREGQEELIDQDGIDRLHQFAESKDVTEDFIAALVTHFISADFEERVTIPEFGPMPYLRKNEAYAVYKVLKDCDLNVVATAIQKKESEDVALLEPADAPEMPDMATPEKPPIINPETGEIIEG